MAYGQTSEPIGRLSPIVFGGFIKYSIRLCASVWFTHRMAQLSLARFQEPTCF